MRQTNHSRFRDESGIALALAIVVVVIAGVMGAGLLLVVRNDLEAVISTNNARRAFYAADAGAQLARRHVLSDPRISSYNDLPGPDGCSPPGTDEDLEDPAWSYSKGGVTREFGGGEFTTRILVLGDGCGVPETEAGERYFRVFSEGRFGETRRLVEATYVTRDIGAPLAVHAAGNVMLGPLSTVSGQSVFAGGDVDVSAGATLSSEDGTYPRWPTEDPQTNEEDAPVSIAAVGAVSGASTTFYDSTTDPAFVASEPSSGELTYPFDAGFWDGRDHLSFMREEADRQGNFQVSTNFAWPDGSTANTIVYVEPEGQKTTTIDESVCPRSRECRGTLVVDGGGVVVESGVDFYSAVVSTGGDVVVQEGALVEGFIASRGDIEVLGEVRAPGPESAIRPGYFGVEIVSWREPAG